MNFKIDTRETYSLITTPEAPLSGEMAEALMDTCTSLAESGSQNFIVDVSACHSADARAAEALCALHESCYTQERSLAFTGAQQGVMAVLQEHGAAEVLNLAPTMAEAVDIVSMEILERDLMREDGESEW